MRVRSTAAFTQRTRAICATLGLTLGCIIVWQLSESKNVTAQATPTRIAVIDVQKVLTQSAPGKASFTKLSQLQADRLAKARAMDEEIRKLNATLTTTRATLTPARVNELQRQIEEKQTALKRFGEDAQREITSTRDRELLALEARVNPIVNGIGREMGLAAIFNKFESGLIFANDAIDITDTVITRFNAAAPPAAVPATTPARPAASPPRP